MEGLTLTVSLAVNYPFFGDSPKIPCIFGSIFTEKFGSEMDTGYNMKDILGQMEPKGISWLACLFYYSHFLQLSEYNSLACLFVHQRGKRICLEALKAFNVGVKVHLKQIQKCQNYLNNPSV